MAAVPTYTCTKIATVPGQDLKWVQVKGVTLFRGQVERRSGAVFFPRTARGKPGSARSGQFQQRREAGGEILRLVAGIAQREDRFLARPGSPAVDFEARGIASNPVGIFEGLRVVTRPLRRLGQHIPIL